MNRDEPLLCPNNCVKRVVAFVPRGHMHARFILELCGQKIILNEAAVAGIVRAYAAVAMHPTRRAIELVAEKVPEEEKKPLYAEWQLVETGRPEEEVLREAEEEWRNARSPEEC